VRNAEDGKATNPGRFAARMLLVDVAKRNRQPHGRVDGAGRSRTGSKTEEL
jgi:hypothetical protein